MFNNKELEQVVSALRAAGGIPYLVGGSVRDLALAIQPKDLDLEVYGLSSGEIVKAVEPLGKVDTVGQTFGVILLRVGKQVFDIAVPRRESKVGVGHKGFIAKPDPTMTPQEAASRRDYTINALMYDFESQNIMDFYGGRDDLKNRILRHVGPAFAEDPLRVLRGFQFASRFDLTVAEETAVLCQQLFSEYQTLSVERIWNEWLKWTKGAYPSQGLKFLRDTGWIDAYPEIKNLIDCPQNPEWHPEGDVFVHTCFVVDEAATIARREGVWGSIIEAKKPKKQQIGYDRALLLFSALCHDFGKPKTTVWIPDRDETPGSERWRSPGHGGVGVPLLNDFLERIGCPQTIIEYTGPLVKHHLDYINGAARKTVRKLAANLVPATIEQLLWLIEADHSGRPPLPKGLPELAQDVARVAAELEVQARKPVRILTGHMLLQHKLLEPGPAMGKFLAQAYMEQLEGAFDNPDDALIWARNHLND